MMAESGCIIFAPLQVMCANTEYSPSCSSYSTSK